MPKSKPKRVEPAASEGPVVKTQYGEVDRQALGTLQDRYDTTRLLRAIDELDALVGDLKSEGGLRDDLLRLHGMAHVVINGAMSGPRVGEDTLPELAWDVGMVIRESIETLQRWRKLVEPLEALQPDI